MVKWQRSLEIYFETATKKIHLRPHSRTPVVKTHFFAKIVREVFAVF